MSALSESILVPDSLSLAVDEMEEFLQRAKQSAQKLSEEKNTKIIAKNSQKKKEKMTKTSRIAPNNRRNYQNEFDDENEEENDNNNNYKNGNNNKFENDFVFTDNYSHHSSPSSSSSSLLSQSASLHRRRLHLHFDSLHRSLAAEDRRRAATRAKLSSMLEEEEARSRQRELHSTQSAINRAMKLANDRQRRDERELNSVTRELGRELAKSLKLKSESLRDFAQTQAALIEEQSKIEQELKSSRQREIHRASREEFREIGNEQKIENSKIRNEIEQEMRKQQWLTEQLTQV